MISQVASHITTPKRKREQKPNKTKEKEKGQNPGCYNSYPLKEISSSRFSCSGNKYDLRIPFPTRASFFPLFIVPPRISDDQLTLLWGGLLHLSPNSDGYLLISAVISNGSEHKFAFGHENLFTFVMGLLQINESLLGSINA